MRHVLLALPMDPSPQSDRDLPMGDVLDKSALYGGIMRQAYRRGEGLAGRKGDESMPHYPTRMPPHRHALVADALKRVPTLVGMDDHHHDAILVATS